MFAQTGIDPKAPNAVPSTDAASSGIWWLIPLAIGCLGLIWYLRRLNNSTVQTSGRKDPAKRASTKAKSVAVDTPDAANGSAADRQGPSNKSSSKKKKKKGQDNNQRNAKKSKEKQFESKVVAKSVAELNVSSEQLAATASLAERDNDTKASDAAQAPSPPLAPVAAIFEPLRSVTPPRQRVSTLERLSENVKPTLVSDESVNRPASGGKFERMVPSTAYTRAAANRWPASMTNSVERTVTARPTEANIAPKPLSTETAAVANPETAHTSVPQAKGLKSFVSKLKTASTADLESTGNVSDVVTAREENQ